MSAASEYRLSRLSKVKPCCLQAIATMRDFLDEAEKLANDERNDPETIVERVLHRMSWGVANASSGLCAAISALRDARRIEEEDEES